MLTIGSIKSAGGSPWRGPRSGCPLPAPPTLADVAERAGVSRQTVSNAVNNPDLLRPDTLDRVQEAIAELGYSPNRAARNLRTRAVAPDRAAVRPAQEGTANAAMDRFVHSLVETAARGRLPRAALLRRRTSDPVAGYDDLLRSTAVDAFVVTDTYLGNPQAAWLRSGARRSSRSAGRGTTPRPATRGSTSTAPPAATLATQHLIDRGHTGSRGSAGARTPARRGPPLRLAARDAHARPPHHGLASRVEDTVAVRPRGRARSCSTRPPDGVRLRLRHPGDGGAAHPRATAAHGRQATSRSSASTTPRSPRWCRPG